MDATYIWRAMPATGKTQAKPALHYSDGIITKEKAERVGFEPTRRLQTAYAISSRAPSANSDTSPNRRESTKQVSGMRASNSAHGFIPTESVVHKSAVVVDRDGARRG